MMSRRYLLMIALLSGSLLAQSPEPEPQPAPPQPGFTLHTEARIVLTDVTVTDRNGNVVHGIPASAFHVTDDKQPQKLTSFEEHNAASTSLTDVPASAPGTYSNEYLMHLPPVLNIIMLDVASLNITEQMYLNFEFAHFLQALPPKATFALYARTGDSTVLVQNFTSDHALLAAAAAKVMPHLRPVGTEPSSDTSTLFQIANELVQISGRKNVLWFTGGSSVLLRPDPMEAMEDPAALRQVYDQLEAARIALYPIDARGLSPNAGMGVSMQHMQMEEIAESTGGQAYINTNGLAQSAEKILANDNSFYTLTFVPQNFRPDNKWHKIQITLDSPGYTLSYRRGYFADGNNTVVPENSNKTRTRLLQDGKTASVPVNLKSTPILFQASIVPASEPAPDPSEKYYPIRQPQPTKKGATAYVIRYTLPNDAFFTNTVDGKPSMNFNVAALSADQRGDVVARVGEHVSLAFPPRGSEGPIRLQQPIDLRAGENYLFLAIWDAATGRVGTLQVPVTVPHPGKNPH